MIISVGNVDAMVRVNRDLEKISKAAVGAAIDPKPSLPGNIFFIDYLRASQSHPNTATGIRAVWVMVKILQEATRTFERLGFSVGQQIQAPQFGTLAQEVTLGKASLMLRATQVHVGALQRRFLRALQAHRKGRSGCNYVGFSRKYAHELLSKSGIQERLKTIDSQMLQETIRQVVTDFVLTQELLDENLADLVVNCKWAGPRRGFARHNPSNRGWLPSAGADRIVGQKASFNQQPWRESYRITLSRLEWAKCNAHTGSSTLSMGWFKAHSCARSRTRARSAIFALCSEV